MHEHTVEQDRCRKKCCCGIEKTRERGSARGDGANEVHQETSSSVVLLFFGAPL
jgi:hypothetical protein